MSLWKVSTPWLCLLGTLILSRPVQAGPLENSIAASLSSYTREMSVDPDSASIRFVGFSAEGLDQSYHIDIFHAFSPMDITIKSYQCNGENSCKLFAENPRCFYFAQAGNYSIYQMNEAYEESLQLLPKRENSGDSLIKAKFWQSLEKIYGRFSLTSGDSSGVLEDWNFACSPSEDATIQCARIQSSDLSNEP